MWSKVVESGRTSRIDGQSGREWQRMRMRFINPANHRKITSKTRFFAASASFALLAIASQGQTVNQCFVAITQPAWTKRDGSRCLPSSSALSTRAMVAGNFISPVRSEEHTSELQSRFDLVCRLLLEKKKKKI